MLRKTVAMVTPSKRSISPRLSCVCHKQHIEYLFFFFLIYYPAISGAGESLGPTGIKELYYSFCCSLIILNITSPFLLFCSFYSQMRQVSFSSFWCPEFCSASKGLKELIINRRWLWKGADWGNKGGDLEISIALRNIPSHSIKAHFHMINRTQEQQQHLFFSSFVVCLHGTSLNYIKSSQSSARWASIHGSGFFQRLKMACLCSRLQAAPCFTYFIDSIFARAILGQ